MRPIVPGAAALRSAALIVALSAALLLAGCARETPEQKGVRLAAKRYLSAITQKDVGALQRMATCVVGMSSIRGGQVLRIGDPRWVTLGALDSLSHAMETAHRTADSLWASAEEGKADSLSQMRQRLGFTSTIYRNAIRAVNASNPDTVFAPATLLETRALRVRIRYAGPLVGPQPVDREEVLRMLRAPSGRWIVFSMFLTADDPDPAGV
jgi:hypothetical protein